MQLVRAALYALADPTKGFAFDDFDLRPKEWELARQKYVRDLNALTRLFVGRALTR